MSRDAAVATAAPTIRIRPARGWPLPDLAELWRFRGVLARLGIRDLKVRYKQTVLGVTWIILQPLIAAGIFSFVFGGVAGLEAPGRVPYFVFSYAGLLAWSLFSGLVGRASNALVGSAHLVQKVYFPRLLLPLSNTFSSVVDFFVAASVLVVLLLAFWTLPGATVLAAPLVLLLVVMLALGVGFGAGALAVYYRDVRYLVPVAVQFLLYASPVAYAYGAVPDRYTALYRLNPLTGLLEAFRWSVLGVDRPDAFLFLYPAAFSVIVFCAGVLLFKRLERGFADVI